MRRFRRATGIVLPLLLLGASAARAQTCGPVLTSIVIDAGLNDWAAVLTDPDNTATDPRDVQRTRDLMTFALTWDSANLYTYWRRNRRSNNTSYLLLYVDRNDNGLMESTDRVAVVRWVGSSRTYTLTVYTYQPVGALGDPLVNGLGSADGYDMPGTLGAALFTGTDDGASTDRVQIEVSMPWNWLGVAGGDAIQFHIASANSLTLPGGLVDNMTGPNGGSNHFARCLVTPDRTLAVVAGDTLVAAHTIRNDGNATAPIELSAAWSCAEPITPVFYWDADGDGLFSSAVDTPILDSNADGNADRDVAAQSNLQILVVTVMPAGIAAGRTCVLQVTATPRGIVECAGQANDTINCIENLLTLLRVADRASAPPGDVITYTTTYTNTGTQTAHAVVLLSAIPANSTYVGGSAAGAGTTASFSHDNGVTFDGLQTPPVTHVRWTLAAPVPGGASGNVQYQARID